MAATLSMLGCKERPRGSGGEADSKHAPDPASAKEAAKACAGAEAHGPLRWFDDDYQAALGCARAARKPLIIDAWAPWCHTCISMQTTVLMDPSLAPLADRFVWLRVDTDKPVNGAVVGKFPPEMWPTFFVVAPEDESVQGRHLGAASVSQFREFLQQSEAAYLDSKRGALPDGSPLALAREGDRAVVAGNGAAAVRAYREALAAAPKDWPRRPQVLVSLIGILYHQEEWDACVSLAVAEMGNTGRSASASDFAYHATKCAEDVFNASLVREVRELAAKRLELLIEDDSAPLSQDDRADAMRILRETREALGDVEGARALAERQRIFLDEAAAAAPSPFAAMTYNWPRAEVYLYLDRLEELVPDLEKSVADLPNEYDPPYRLAWVYHKLGAYDKALPLAQTALERAYGPHQARILSLLADIHKARGDIVAEREARKEVLNVYASLPEGQREPLALRRAFETLLSGEESAKQTQGAQPAEDGQPAEDTEPAEDAKNTPKQTKAPKSEAPAQEPKGGEGRR